MGLKKKSSLQEPGLTNIVMYTYCPVSLKKKRIKNKVTAVDNNS